MGVRGVTVSVVWGRTAAHEQTQLCGAPETWGFRWGGDGRIAIVAGGGNDGASSTSSSTISAIVGRRQTQAEQRSCTAGPHGQAGPCARP